MTTDTIFDVFGRNDLDNLASALSDESSQRIQTEAKRLLSDLPKVSGTSETAGQNLTSIPRSLPQCIKKIRYLIDRYLKLRRYCFLVELSERSVRRELREALREKRELSGQVLELQDDLSRARNQLRAAFGIKQKRAAENKDDSTKADGKKEKKKRGAPKGHTGKTRPIPGQITKTVVKKPPDQCPHCAGNDIKTGEEFIAKYIEDIPKVVKEVIETRYLKGKCLSCHQDVIAEEALVGPPVTVGPNLTSLLTILRQQGGVSYRKLSRLSTECFKISLTPSGVLGIISRVSGRLEPFYKGIEACLPMQPVIHGDETGWKNDGERWYLWCLCNKDMTYFHLNRSRATKVVTDILPKDYSGIVHSDFYGAYNIYANTQRCLVHLMRDIKNELEIKPKNSVLKKLKGVIKQITDKGQQIQKLKESSKKERQKAGLKAKLLKLCQLKSSDRKVSNLIKRIDRYQDHLLQFMNHRDAEFHNNRAERALRPAVIFRKISFGNRSQQGADNFAILSSVLETGRQKNKDLTLFIQSVLSGPSINSSKVKEFLIDSS